MKTSEHEASCGQERSIGAFDLALSPGLWAFGLALVLHMGQLRYRIPKRCAFCSNKPNSKEHAWPQWLLNALEVRLGAKRLIGMVEGERARIDATQKSLKVPCVCMTCNTVWMKRLEDAAIPLLMPMLGGAETRLDILQQWTIAAWALNTAMVFEFITLKRALFYGNDDRTQFRTSQLPPSFSFVWLARLVAEPGTHPLATYGVDGYGANEAAASVTPYQTTLVTGQLIVQVITVRPNEGETRGAVIHPKPGPWHENSVRIWPTQRVIAWPPQLSVTDEEMLGFHRRFENPLVEDGGWNSEQIIFIPPK